LLGLVLAGLAFLILVFGGWAGGDTGRVSMWYLINTYAVITLAELCLSPMGLSLVSKLAAPKQRAMWMGGWFAATSIGGYLSGLVGGYWKVWPHSQFFALLMGISFGAAFILLLLYRRVQSAMPVEGAAQPHPTLPDPEPEVPVPALSPAGGNSITRKGDHRE
jgi:POT family proton-dependent oligopeptide transporter